MRKVYFLLAMVFVVSRVQGQSLFNDDFTYSGNLTANGWTAHSGAGTNAIATTTGLTYAGLTGSGVGNAALVNNLSGEDDNISFSTQSTDGQSIYFSFLGNITDASATKSGDYFFHIAPSPVSTSFSARVFARITVSGVNFGISNTSTITYGTTNFLKNTTYLFIIKYTISVAGNDPVSLWVIPSGVPLTEVAAGTPESTNSATAGQNTIGAVALRQGSATTSVQTVVDAIKVGLTWSDVTPASGTPSLLVAPTSLAFGSLAVGTQSASQSFNLSGSNLTGAPGNITVNSPSTDFQVSNDNSAWGATTTIAYASSTLSATPVYVRFTPQTGGFKSGNVTFSGGGVAIPPTVSLTGTGIKTFFSKSAGNLTNVANWGDVADGSGAAPLDFTSDGQIFTIANRVSVTLDANWAVTGSGSKIILGDGTSLITLILPSGATINNATTNPIDISNNATLDIANNTYRPSTSNIPYPYFGIIDPGSTVYYSWNGISATDTVRVPAGITFGNLSLTNGLKYFSSGTVTVTGNISAISVAGMNGWYQSAFSTINLGGNFSLSSSSFDPIGTGDAARLTLVLTGSGTQTLSGGDFQLFRLQTLATPPATTLNILLSGSNLLLGNASSGGLNLLQSTHTLSLNGGTLTIRASGFFSATNTGTIAGHSLSSLVIDKVSGGTGIGSIGFTSGSRVLNNLTYNSAGTGSNNLTLNTALDVGGNLTLTNGTITLGANDLTLSNATTGAIAAYSAASYIVTNGAGALKRAISPAGLYTFPVGTSTKLEEASVNFASISGANTLAARFITGDGGTNGLPVVDGVTTIPYISTFGYWEINAATSMSDLYDGTFIANSFTNMSGYPYTHLLKRVDNISSWTVDGAHVTTTGSNTLATLQRTGMTGFSQFAVGKLSADAAPPLPVSIVSFSGYKDGSRNQLRWTTASEQNNRGFDVMRSADGINYTSIGFVNSQASGGNSDLQLNYTYTDNNITDGKQYYRLRQQDFDGHSKFSNIVLIKGDKPLTLMMEGLFPNPASTIVNVMIAAPVREKVSLVITDVTGRTVAQQLVNVETGSNTIPVDISRLNAGSYMVKLVCSSNCESQVGRFIKK